jgi:hypothetical protein
MAPHKQTITLLIRCPSAFEHAHKQPSTCADVAAVESSSNRTHNIPQLTCQTVSNRARIAIVIYLQVNGRAALFRLPSESCSLKSITTALANLQIQMKTKTSFVSNKKLATFFRAGISHDRRVIFAFDRHVQQCNLQSLVEWLEQLRDCPKPSFLSGIPGMAAQSQALNVPSSFTTV